MKKPLSFLFFIFILFACSTKDAEKSISYDSTAKAPEQKESIGLSKDSILPESPDTLKRIASSTKQSNNKKNTPEHYYNFDNTHYEIYTHDYELYPPKNFVDSLYYEASKKCTDTLSNINTATSLITNLSSGSVYMDTLSRWQILFATSFSLNEYFIIGSGISKHTVSSPPKRFYCNNGKIYKGTELFEGLKIQAKYLTDTTIQNKVIFGRGMYSLGNNDEENGNWIPVIMDDYLMLSFQGGYIGQSQSSYSETKIYFKKVE